jgi:hypothetical protein
MVLHSGPEEVTGRWFCIQTTRRRLRSQQFKGYGISIMPFSLYNTPVTFDWLMETVLRGLSYESCLMYLDDLSRDNIVTCMSDYRRGLDW